jgi:hypothetical protein
MLPSLSRLSLSEPIGQEQPHQYHNGSSPWNMQNGKRLHSAVPEIGMHPHGRSPTFIEQHQDRYFYSNGSSLGDNGMSMQSHSFQHHQQQQQQQYPQQQQQNMMHQHQHHQASYCGGPFPPSGGMIGLNPNMGMSFDFNGDYQQHHFNHQQQQFVQQHEGYRNPYNQFPHNSIPYSQPDDLVDIAAWNAPPQAYPNQF